MQTNFQIFVIFSVVVYVNYKTNKEFIFELKNQKMQFINVDMKFHSSFTNASLIGLLRIFKKKVDYRISDCDKQ